ncbi:MAG TPA: glycosyltransferase family 4 protein, partial [Steroidobacteraceae bacterium]|nr:glycosyltransferase family 4 protein [Steroidobacteraceae bacterium]
MPQTDDHRPQIMLLGPRLDAVSGVSSHLLALIRSPLANRYRLRHFQVGSEGRNEGPIARLLRLLGSPFALWKAIRRYRPAVVHLNSSLNRDAFWRDMIYVMVARLGGAKALYQVHGGSLSKFLGTSRLREGVLRRLLLLPSVVVVLSERELAAQRALVPKQNIKLIPNAIDTAPYLRLPLRQYSAASSLELIYLGRLTREKGLYELLQALAIARSQGAHARLCIVGSGVELARLKHSVERLQLSSAVTFAGAAFGVAKLDLLSRADVLALPSYSEGLPYALLEGMAAGKTVLVTPVGAIPDVVTAEQHGVLVPPRDVTALASAIVHLAANRANLASTGAACRQRVATQYSMEQLVRNFSALYD